MFSQCSVLKSVRHRPHCFAPQDLVCSVGDTLAGDTLRSTLAEVIAQLCEQDAAKDIDFSVINVKGDSPSIDVVRERLEALT